MHATDCPTATEMNSVCSAQRPATPRRRGRQPEPHTKHTLDCGSVYTKFRGRRVSLSRPGWWWLHKHSLYNPSSNCLCFIHCSACKKLSLKQILNFQAPMLVSRAWCPGGARGSERPSEVGLSRAQPDISPLPAPPAFPFLQICSARGPRAETDGPGSQPAWGWKAAEPVLPQADSSVGLAQLDPLTRPWTPRPVPRRSDQPCKVSSQSRPLSWRRRSQTLVWGPEICHGKEHGHLHNNSGINKSSFHLAQGYHAGCPPSYPHSSWTAQGRTI